MITTLFPSEVHCTLQRTSPSDSLQESDTPLYLPSTSLLSDKSSTSSNTLLASFVTSKPCRRLIRGKVRGTFFWRMTFVTVESFLPLLGRHLPLSFSSHLSRYLANIGRKLSIRRVSYRPQCFEEMLVSEMRNGIENNKNTINYTFCMEGSHRGLYLHTFGEQLLEAFAACTTRCSC